MKRPVLVWGVCYITEILAQMRERIRSTRKHNPIPFMLGDGGLLQNYDRLIIGGATGRSMYGGQICVQHDVFDMMEYYNDKVGGMYGVIQLRIIPEHWNMSAYRDFSHRWFFVNVSEMHSISAAQLREKRKVMIRMALDKYPKLKFVICVTPTTRYDELDDYLNSLNVDMSRFLFWNMRFSMSQREWQVVYATIDSEENAPKHPYPTESSYRELFDMILHDADKSP